MQRNRPHIPHYYAALPPTLFIMPHIQIKRVYDTADPTDGYRILVDRLWPRGIRKDALPYDLWAKDLTPSTPLRQWFHEAPDERWLEFRRRYRLELAAAPSMSELISRIQPYDTVTLLYAAKDSAHNHALILQDYLTERMS